MGLKFLFQVIMKTRRSCIFLVDLIYICLNVIENRISKKFVNKPDLIEICSFQELKFCQHGKRIK